MADSEPVTLSCFYNLSCFYRLSCFCVGEERLETDLSSTRLSAYASLSRHVVRVSHPINGALTSKGRRHLLDLVFEKTVAFT